MDKYSAIIQWSPKDGVFVARCPELKDLASHGPTRAKAAAEIDIAVTLALETYREEGLELPEPAKFDMFEKGGSMNEKSCFDCCVRGVCFIPKQAAEFQECFKPITGNREGEISYSNMISQFKVFIAERCRFYRLKED